VAERERELAVELEQANSAMRDFIAVASHDLRTPITVVKGFAQTIRAEWGALAESDMLTYLGMIERQADQLARLVDDLLTVSRIDAAVLDPDPRPLGVAAAVEEILREHSFDTGTVTVDVPPDLVALVDPDHFSRIVSNYLGNARFHGAPPIRVEGRCEGREVVVRVCDSGNGVPASFRPRLFDRFARRDRAKAGDRGTGLGLSIVMGLARAAGGYAWYEDNEPNGACFAVRLPSARGSR
jgi:signal transduction histidine kinase